MDIQPVYYEAVAPLVPVLVIAAAVERFAFGGTQPATRREVTKLVLGLLMLSLAEFVGLRVLATGRGSEEHFYATVVGLSIAWALFVTSLLLRQLARLPGFNPSDRRSDMALALAACGVGIGLPFVITVAVIFN